MKMCYFSAAINTSYKGVQKYLCVCLKTRLSGSFFSDRLGKAILHYGSLHPLEKLCLRDEDFTMEEELSIIEAKIADKYQNVAKRHIPGCKSSCQGLCLGLLTFCCC